MDLTTISAELGISPILLGAILIWTIFWKLAGLWKSARRGSIIWFILIAIINTVGILPILYIFIFSKIKFDKKPKKKTKKKKPRKK